MRNCLLAMLIAALYGCASSSTRVDPDQLSEVRKGETTFDEIVHRFGRPNFLSRNWDGTRTAAYASGEGRSDAAKPADDGLLPWWLPSAVRDPRQ